MTAYPKRLIEVDLPIKRISEHARREKSIRHGHISTLHIWWARRPLAACRAVILAALWPDPADPLCPERFRKEAAQWMLDWANKHANKASEVSFKRFIAIQKNPTLIDDPVELRHCLLDFIADFSNWDNSTDRDYLETSRALVQVAHESLGGTPGTRPLVVDPFAGGGSIPLEALRVGADAFASDLNPVAVLLNKVVLEYIPKYGQRLADEVRKWGEWIKKEAEKELAEFYPKDADGATPIAYLWARTIQCEGPGCGVEVPMVNQLWIKKKGSPTYAFAFSTSSRKRIDIRIVENPPAKTVAAGTSRQGSVTCPCCGFTTPAERVREQGRHKGLGARLMGVVLSIPGSTARRFRSPINRDFSAIESATHALSKVEAKAHFSKNLRVKIPLTELRRISVPLYGVDTFDKMFLPRQRLVFDVLELVVRRAFDEQKQETDDTDFQSAVSVILALSVSNTLHYNMNLSTYLSNGMVSAFIQGTSLAMRSDFAEANPLMRKLVGGLDFSLNQIYAMLERHCDSWPQTGTAQCFSATAIGLPDDGATLIATDPPYYDSVPYSHLSDVFYIWLKSSLRQVHDSMFNMDLTDKDAEIVEDRAHSKSPSKKRADFYERGLTEAFAESRRVLDKNQLMVLVFAHKSTRGWESMLNGLLTAKWTIVSSWPIDTERPERMNAYQNASLLSSVHVACRPLRANSVGDWRDVLQALPRRIHEWMPRLAKEGVVGADAIFACLGPALEIFSRYSRVEKSSGEEVKLKEYLEHVWAAVAKEALGMIFEGADASGFEEDARLTAMWLWTLSTGTNGLNGSAEEETDEEDEEEGSAKKPKLTGFSLEYDAARKIAQGLGVHLEGLKTLVEIKGDTARLLPVSERTRALFGKDESDAPAARRRKKEPQLKLGFVAEVEEAEEAGGWGQKGAPKQGETVLDRVHQAIILFASGRGEALKRFLVEDGVGRDERFWRLAQALAALYPKVSEERRWVEGVLARKKGFGF